jgi:hypothetical protein
VDRFCLDSKYRGAESIQVYPRSIEVFNAVGDTIAVTAVTAAALEPLREDEILCARSLGAP